jgi:hypothetical protein
MTALDEKNSNFLNLCNENHESLHFRKKFKDFSFSNFFTFLFIFYLIKLFTNN